MPTLRGPGTWIPEGLQPVLRAQCGFWGERPGRVQSPDWLEPGQKGGLRLEPGRAGHVPTEEKERERRWGAKPRMAPSDSELRTGLGGKVPCLWPRLRFPKDSLSYQRNLKVERERRATLGIPVGSQVLPQHKQAPGCPGGAPVTTHAWPGVWGEHSLRSLQDLGGPVLGGH